MRIGRGKFLLHKNEPGNSHFMSAESTCLYYHKLLTDAFDLQREKHGLAGKRGMLVADAFTGNFAQKEGC